MTEFVRTEPGDDPIIVDCTLEASPSDVFEAWTDPEIIMQWFGPRPNTLASATIDLRVGGQWCFVKSKNEEGTTGFEGEYLIIEPAKRLAFTWAQFTNSVDGEKDLTPFSKVEIEMDAVGQETHLRLIHSSLPDKAAATDFAGGWERAFGNLLPLMAQRA